VHFHKSLFPSFPREQRKERGRRERERELGRGKGQRREYRKE
jgi:hypothetical protein